jgi:flagellar M-ring protein FliF
MSGSSNLLEIKHRHERNYRKEVDKILKPIFGSQLHYSTAVTVAVETEAIETQENIIDPASQVAISEQLSTSSSTEGNAQGIPGTGSNLPEQAPASEGGNANESEKISTNYEISRKIKTTIKKPGEIKSLSISVAINSIKLEELAQSGTTTQTVDEIKKNIEAAVKSAVGFDADRDQLEVKYFPFAGLDDSTY